MTPPHVPFVQCISTPIQIECEKTKIAGSVAWAHHLPSCMIWHHITIENECIPRDAYTSVDVYVVTLLLDLWWWRNDPRRDARRRERSVLSIDCVARSQRLCFISYRLLYWLLHVPWAWLCYWCHGRRSVVVFYWKNEVLRRLVLIGYLGCMCVLLIGPVGFGSTMTISCVKGAALVDWVQGVLLCQKGG
jgi:hypothetical protein